MLIFVFFKSQHHRKDDGFSILIVKMSEPASARIFILMIGDLETTYGNYSSRDKNMDFTALTYAYRRLVKGDR